MEKMPEVIRRKHLALKTEQCSRTWLGRYCDDLEKVPVHLTSEQNMERLTTVLTKYGGAGNSQIASL